ncbi:BhlA/UviB family holin-like peptide [Vagococcus xieshaowenii]|uniref:BhlA holin family protein n=1 Tax=Vagococcus xieshaowenii TaxID=2562451 RepID=A0A4Z0DAN6_9ENTE|nr:BhlA/UviB family holin-like peptide [Vagococcus xieshaowenii]QCA28267.1 hypothetical protein E4Z98_02655 [Vagococcus xieshaowenii]TFZ41922.1 hypothetical protein E4031_04835 [Vagococcus xieshaowenii]
MNEITELVFNNAGNISFAVLFVLLLVWVMKKNDEREKRYQKMIEDLTSAVSDMQAIKSTVDKIHEKLN